MRMKRPNVLDVRNATKLLMSKLSSECNPVYQVSFGWQSRYVIHYIKPNQGGYLEPKKFQDPSTFS